MLKLNSVLLFFFFPFIAFANDGCGEFNPQWLKCIKDQDCVIVADPCGWPRATSHTKFSKEARNFNACKGSVLDCSAYDIERDGSFKARCEQKKCQVLPQK